MKGYLSGVLMRLMPAATLLMLALPLAAQVQPVPAPTPETQVPKAKAKPRVRIQTSFGPITLELEPELAPKTVENFLAYVKEGYYTGTIFHRVVAGTVIQGGGLKEDLTDKPGHPPIINEVRSTFAAGLKNTAGTVAMARAENPHSATSQFFINISDNPVFDPQGPSPEGYGYCVFGRVVDGMASVAKIDKVQTSFRKGYACVPEYPVRIKSAELLPEDTQPETAQIAPPKP